MRIIVACLSWVVDWLIDWVIGWFFILKLITWFGCWFVNWFGGLVVCQLVNWLVGWSIRKLIGFLIDWFVVQFIGWAMDWWLVGVFLGCCADWLADWNFQFCWFPRLFLSEAAEGKHAGCPLERLQKKVVGSHWLLCPPSAPSAVSPHPMFDNIPLFMSTSSWDSD